MALKGRKLEEGIDIDNDIIDMMVKREKLIL